MKLSLETEQKVESAGEDMCLEKPETLKVSLITVGDCVRDGT